MINLSSYGAVESAMFLKWSVPTRGTSYLSDYHTDITIDGQVYHNIGNLLSITGVQSELKASKSQLTITLSGIVPNSISDILDYDIKGSSIQIYRGFFDPTTHALIDLTPNVNPTSLFKGIVTNFTLTDVHDPDTNIDSTTIVLTANSAVEILDKKVSGRRTNSADFSSEKSMDRVQALANAFFNFGAPK